ncbi:MAG: DNA polymerase III subunit delta [Coriobacteriales bacterium]|nr:DNA polymerase III subunit delta [Coriobacteriales bacterium]
MAGSGLLAAYLIVGADQLKRDTAVKRLKARLDQSFEAFNLDERTANASVLPADIAISLNTLPVGAGFRLVLIHEADKLPKPTSESIISYLANPNPDCVLCLETQSLPKNTRLYKAVAKVGKRSVIDCTPIGARDLPQYVIKHAAAKGLSIDQAAARELISRAGESTTLLDRQLITLADMSATPGLITREDVCAHVARTAEVKPWEFLDKISAGDAAGALELYRHMQSPNHLALLTLITRRVRELICARALIDRGQQRQIARELGRQEWQVRSVVSAARRFTTAQLNGCLAACAQCERDLKSGADAESSFLQLVLGICRPA